MNMVTPIRAGDTLGDHCEYIARYARALSTHAVFLEGLTHTRGELTMAHVELHSARLSIARAHEAIDCIAAEADAYLKERVS